jgi:hypothetical protein
MRSGQRVDRYLLPARGREGDFAGLAGQALQELQTAGAALA